MDYEYSFKRRLNFRVLANGRKHYFVETIHAYTPVFRCLFYLNPIQSNPKFTGILAL